MIDQVDESHGWIVTRSSLPDCVAGAIIVGRPYGTASGVERAFEQMRDRTCERPRYSRARDRSVLLRAKIASPSGTEHMTRRYSQSTPSRLPFNGPTCSTRLRRTGCDRSINSDSRKIWLDESDKPGIETNLIKGMAHDVPLPLTAKAPLENPAAAGGPNFFDRTRGWLRDTGSIRPRQQDLGTKTR